MNQDLNKSSVQQETTAASCRKEFKIQTSTSKVVLAIFFSQRQLQVV
jgi:hypothetical protein